MRGSRLRVAFAGTPPFAVPTLDSLHRAGHEIRGVFTQVDRPAGRGRVLRPSAVKQRAFDLGLPVHQPSNFRAAEAIDALRRLEIDVFVVVAYGSILPPEALAVPPLGCLNVHASLLPRWRGAAPIQRAILAGDALTGVSIMRMDAGLDTGPVFATARVAIGSADTAKSLAEPLSVAGAKLLCETLDLLVRGAATATPQEAAGVTYAAKIEKSEALIDWGADAADIERRVRAFVPWPVAETVWRGERLRILQATLTAGAASAHAGAGSLVAASSQGIDVACGHDVLRILRLQRPNRNPVDALGFVNAGVRVGERFGQR